MLCGECVKKCSSELRDADFKRMTEADFLQHVVARDEDRRRYAQEFVRTRTIQSGDGALGTAYVYADDTHGWWVRANVNDPDVFTYKQAAGVMVESQTLTLSSDEDRRRREMEWVQLYNSIAGGYPGVPLCPPNKRITGLKVKVTITGHPFITEVNIPVSINATNVQMLLREECRVVSEMVQFFMTLRMQG